MKKFWFLLLALCLTEGAYAQFTSGDRVYCYEYEYTMEDGIRSQTNSNQVIFVNFQNDMLGFVYSLKSEVESKSVGYFEKEAQNKLASNYRKWNSSPANAYEQADIFSYDTSNSSSSKYTYRRYSKTANANISPYGANVYWTQPFWNADCYTFSSDKNTLCIWYIGTPRNRVNFNFGPTNYKIRRYYKLIDVNNLKPNVDDLW